MELADSSEKPMTDEPSDGLQLTVCVCTYRRPQLRDTLASLAAQALPPGVTMRVVVADNDEQDGRRGEIEQWFSELGLDGQYVHAPKRNISIARNSCLDSARSRWVAFIDDDEVAPPDWLGNLLSSRDNVECVFGVSRANYDGSGAPGWMVRGEFHSNIIRQRDGAANGYTCNVLFDADFVRRHGLRFREDLGQVGGEDTMFFREMEAAGARFGYNPEAVVHEDVPPSRANLRWLVNRQFRSGQNHCELLLAKGKSPVAIVGMSTAKAALFSLIALCTLPAPSRAAGNFLRGALHWGVARRAMGRDFHREYG